MGISIHFGQILNMNGPYRLSDFSHLFLYRRNLFAPLTNNGRVSAKEKCVKQTFTCRYHLNEQQKSHHRGVMRHHKTNEMLNRFQVLRQHCSQNSLKHQTCVIAVASLYTLIILHKEPRFEL